MCVCVCVCIYSIYYQSLLRVTLAGRGTGSFWRIAPTSSARRRATWVNNSSYLPAVNPGVNREEISGTRCPAATN